MRFLVQWSSINHYLTPKKCIQGHEIFFGHHQQSPKGILALPYYGNVSSSKTIFGVIFFQFLIFVRNFGNIQGSDLDEILHGGSPWCEVPPIKILSKSVDNKGGNDIIFSQLYPKKTFFLNLGTLNFFGHSMFFP